MTETGRAHPLRQSLAVSLTSWLPLMGTLALGLYYFVAYRTVGTAAASHAPLRAGAAGNYLLFVAAINAEICFLLYPILWLLALLSARVRGLSYGRANWIIFCVGWASILLLFLSDYGTWLMT